MTEGYQLGSAPAELERLNRQGDRLAPATRMILSEAGLRPGMRVLDLGAGAGDLSLLAAELVGPSGEVVGIEQSPQAVASATERARALGRDNVRFAVGDINRPADGGPFDAIIGRLVLMHVPDPVAVLRIHSESLASGGLVIPIEFDVDACQTVPATPLAEQVVAWLRDAFNRAGVPLRLGPHMWSILVAAGLRPLGMLGVQTYFGPTDPDGAAVLAGIARSSQPLIERTGVVSAAELAVDTLQDRLAAEFAGAGAVFAYPALVSAWGTIA